jgi:hypothetical protein
VSMPPFAQGWVLSTAVCRCGPSSVARVAGYMVRQAEAQTREPMNEEMA